jgi:hypothetical protein
VRPGGSHRVIGLALARGLPLDRSGTDRSWVRSRGFHAICTSDSAAPRAEAVELGSFARFSRHPRRGSRRAAGRGSGVGFVRAVSRRPPARPPSRTMSPGMMFNSCRSGVPTGTNRPSAGYDPDPVRPSCIKIDGFDGLGRGRKGRRGGSSRRGDECAALVDGGDVRRLLLRIDQSAVDRAGIAQVARGPPVPVLEAAGISAWPGSVPAACKGLRPSGDRGPTARARSSCLYRIPQLSGFVHAPTGRADPLLGVTIGVRLT